MKVTLKQLKVFVEVAKTNSISQGAEHCFISQSAASISLSQLESNIGVLLFNRYKKKLSINSDGQIMLSKAINILEKIHEFEMHNIPDNLLRGNITIAANPVIADYILPGLISKFVDEYKNINISIMSGNLDTSFENIDKGYCDIGFVEGRTPLFKVKCNEIVIKKVNLKIICSINNKLSKKTKVFIDDIFHNDWVQHEDTLSSRDITISKFDENSHIMRSWIGTINNNGAVEINDVIFNYNGELIKENSSIMRDSLTLPSIESVKNFVANSDNIAVISESAISKYEIGKKFHVLDIQDLTMTRNHIIIYKNDKNNTKVVELFSNWLQRQKY
ncbi:MAG: DNA-binding transcriptional LysR family regulator [Francisella sp.]|jgi:DNA-binding transcriptional LysR family regulator